MHVANLKPRNSSRPARNDDDDGQPPFHQHIVWSVIAGGAALALMGLALGSFPVKIACLIVALSMLQGLWRGAAEIVGFVVGMGLSVLIAPPLGRAFEPAIGAMLGTGGIINRVVSVGLVAGFLTVVIGVAGSIVAKRFMKHKPHLRAYDRYAGAVFGLLEGFFLALMILWVPVALQPVAQMRVAEDREAYLPGLDPTIAQAPRLSDGWTGEVIEFAEKTKRSFLGGIVESTNPLPDTRLLSLASDFAAISQDDEAMMALLSSEPMQQLEALPSVQQAIEAIKADPELTGMVGDGGITNESVLAFFQSNTMLHILDTTTVLQDVGPLGPQIERALRDAKADLDRRRASGAEGGTDKSDGGG